ncbi:MAG: DUF3667 domain-containing protein [Flavipsychrobacter sp.]|nr:DUF3667 domain-containing protein [Flavipsychrobacter sp.]
MSHNSSEPKICPNCGYPAVENYCAQCGQETHLHKDTFGALVGHFVGHYLHYDSKFWKTLRALWFSPGLLTKAYWEEKRMRYIPPISLYIFVSFVFFFISAIMSNNGSDKGPISINDSTYKKKIRIEYNAGPGMSKNSKVDSIDDYDAVARAIKKRWIGSLDLHKIKEKHPNLDEYFNEQFIHLTPKVFFFLIPLMALILKLIFFRRADALYVNHVIFSLHCHAFWFSLWLLSVINIFSSIDNALSVILFFGSVIYLVGALKNAYHVGTLKAVLYSGIIATLYVAFMAISMLLVLLFIFGMA